LELNSWITLPHPLVNNIFYFIVASFFKLVVHFGEKLENNEISKKFFLKGGHSFKINKNVSKKKGVIY
jgi:hypothetical protein